MMIQKSIAAVLLGSCVLSIAACTAEQPGVPVTGETPPITTTPRRSPGLPPEAVLKAQVWLAEQLNVEASQVQATDLEQAEWSDSCLGLGRLNESCAPVSVPGWRVVYEVNGQSYELRIDDTGSTIRVASPEGVFEAPFPGAPGETPGG